VLIDLKAARNGAFSTQKACGFMTQGCDAWRRWPAGPALEVDDVTRPR
jgi:hypothetical protein